MTRDNRNLTWVFVQLPVLSHDFKYNFSHCAYASFVVSSYLFHHCPEINIQRIDALVEALGGDALILNKILEKNPDCVCFSVYLWNIERSLYIASKIKELQPNTLIIFGGPDITLDNGFILTKTGFDIGIIGEGEDSLIHVAKVVLAEKNHEDIIRSLKEIGGITVENKIFLKGKQTPLYKMISPYLSNQAYPSFDGSILIESMRGCIHSCTYCYYHKNFKKVRYVPVEKVFKEIQWAEQNSVKEISFVDPSFLRRKNVKLFLEELAKRTYKDLEIFCELNAEDVCESSADLIARANIKSTEIGLQSINPYTLRLVNRRFDREKFVKGVLNLRQRKINVLLDLMVGLPGDRLEDVTQGVDFIIENDLFDDIGMYPLFVLPGTEMRERASDFGIEFSLNPPYIVKSTTTMSKRDIIESFVYAEHRSGLDLFPREFPLMAMEFGAHDPLMTYLIDLNKDGISFNDFLSKGINKLASSVLIQISHPIWFYHPQMLKKLYGSILNKNPYVLIDIIFDELILKEFSFDRILDTLRKFVKPRNYFIDRIHCDIIDPLRSTQIFFLMCGLSYRCVVSIPSSWYLLRKNSSVFWFMIYGTEN